MSALDFFLLMLPPKQLVLMVDLTNDELAKLDVKLTNNSELLKFFGVLILMTSFEFTSRASLWSFVAPMKHRPAPHFGLTGMPIALTTPSALSDGASNLLNELRTKVLSSIGGSWWMTSLPTSTTTEPNFFNPPDTICADESMSRWYGQGGHWINHGLPQYVAIDRKPEIGCEIQKAACG